MKQDSEIKLMHTARKMRQKDRKVVPYSEFLLRRSVVLMMQDPETTPPTGPRAA